MNYSAIKKFDIANGPGVRVSLFVSGCTTRCPGCFNEELWSFDAGKVFTVPVADSIIEQGKKKFITGLTILGGEPFHPRNIGAVGDFAHDFKAETGKSVWVYTGYKFENLLKAEYSRWAFKFIDVLVDGPFIESKHDIMLRFKGSSNQRIIDVQKSLVENKVVLWEDEPLFANHEMVDRSLYRSLY